MNTLYLSRCPLSLCYQSRGAYKKTAQTIGTERMEHSLVVNNSTLSDSLYRECTRLEWTQKAIKQHPNQATGYFTF